MNALPHLLVSVAVRMMLLDPGAGTFLTIGKRGAVALDWQAVVDHSDAAVAAAANAESCSRNARAASDLGLSRVRRHGRRRGGGDAAGGGGGRGSARGGC